MCAQDYRTAHLEAYQPSGGRSEAHIARTNVSNPTAATVANNEGKMKALAIGAEKMERALRDLRSAHGLVTSKGLDASRSEAKGSSWGAEDLASIEAEYRDKKRGKR